MDSNRFKAIITLIVQQLMELIINNNDIDEVTAIEMLYKSKLYSLLEDEELKLWHYSSLTLYNMYKHEQVTGEIQFPEEA